MCCLPWTIHCTCKSRPEMMPPCTYALLLAGHCSVLSLASGLFSIYSSPQWLAQKAPRSQSRFSCLFSSARHYQSRIGWYQIDTHQWLIAWHEDPSMLLIFQDKQVMLCIWSKTRLVTLAACRTNVTFASYSCNNGPLCSSGCSDVL